MKNEIDLIKAKKAIFDIRENLLFDSDDLENELEYQPIAAQHFLIALDLLSQANRELTLTLLHGNK